MTPMDAQSIILNIIGGQFEERWPEYGRSPSAMRSFSPRSSRPSSGSRWPPSCSATCATSTWCSPLNQAVRPQLGADPKHLDHFRRFLADLASGKYDERYHYFDVLKADWFFISGALNARRSPPSAFARAVHVWDAECMRMRRAEGRWPTLAEQRAFAGL